MTDAPRFATAYNSSDGPLVVDQAGRTIAGRDYGTVEPDRAPASRLIEAGHLVLIEHTTGDVSEAGAAAFAATDARNDGVTAAEQTTDDQPARTTRRRKEA